jgi:carbonic anhydrase
MRKLIQGIVEFRERLRPQYADRFRRLSEGQTPDTLFIACSDSRVVPELIVSTDPGELFVTRNVGNMVPSSRVDGMSTGDLSEGSAIEFSLLVLKVQNVIVCGHSECGAMKAAISKTPLAEAPNLNHWLHNCSSALFRLAQEGPLNRDLPPYDQLSQLNVLVQLEHLMSYPLVRERVDAGHLQLSGWWFDIANAEMLSYERQSRSFERIDRQSAERLIERIDQAAARGAVSQ